MRDLDQNLAAIAGGANLNDLVFELLNWAESQGRVVELFEAALARNPGNARVQLATERVRSLAGSAGVAMPPTTSDSPVAGTVTTRAAKRSLRSALCTFYDDAARAKVIARDAEIPVDDVHFGDGARVFWDQILGAAEPRGRMESLFKVVDDDGDDVHGTWAAAKELYRAAADHERRRRSPRLYVVGDPAPPTSLHSKAIVDLHEAVRRTSPDAFSDPRLAAQALSKLTRAVNNIGTLVVAIETAADAQVANSSERFRLRRVALRVKGQADLMASTIDTLSSTPSARDVRLLLGKLLASAEEVIRDLDEVASAVP